MRLLQEKDTDRYAAGEDSCAHQVGKQEWKFIEDGVGGENAWIADTRLSQGATQSWAQDRTTVRISWKPVWLEVRQLTRDTKQTA